MSSFVVSLDFELAWGPENQALVGAERMSRAREAVRSILDLFRRRGVHATWACVGMLFCSSRDELMSCLPEQRPVYANPKLDAYAKLKNIGADEASAPGHLAGSLVDEIAATPDQEIGSHTFSHFLCHDSSFSRAAFRDDLAAAKRVAKHRGMSLESLVFPRNQVHPEALELARDAGFTVYRGNPPAQTKPIGSAARMAMRGLRLADNYVPIFRPTRPSNGGAILFDARATRFLRPYNRHLAPLEPIRRRRIADEVEFAAKSGIDYHLWWHPHNFADDTQLNLQFLDHVLDDVDAVRRRHDLVYRTMSEAREAARNA